MRTLKREVSHARTYTHSSHSAKVLTRHLQDVNWHWLHGGIDHLAPITRLHVARKDVLAIHRQLAQWGLPPGRGHGISTDSSHASVTEVLLPSAGCPTDFWSVCACAHTARYLTTTGVEGV